VETIREPAELRLILDRVRATGIVGFVPTMGALHAGHETLCRKSVAENDVSAASIFVNPLQFGLGEDYQRYPRDLAADQRLLQESGVDFLFAPDAAAVYPPGFQTRVIVGELSRPLEGAARPGHFEGVATIVLKLFEMVGPCRAYFGEKDFQQLQVIRRMVLDLNVPVEVRGVPTVREADGLAMSSRNRYLTTEERTAAPAIYQALLAARSLAERGVLDPDALLQEAHRRLEASPLIKPEYVALVDPDTLRPVVQPGRSAIMAIAARVGAARLIDNIMIRPPDSRPSAD